MRILFISLDKSIVSGENGDARERMREHARYCEKLIIIIFSLRKDHLHLVTDRNLEVYPTNSVNRWFYVSDALRIIGRLKVDLISTQDPFVAGLVGVLAKLFFGMKLNVQLHNDFFDNPYFRSENLQNAVFYWLGKFNLLFADDVRVVSKRLVKDKRYFVAPVETDPDYFWSKAHTKPTGQIVTISRLVKQKNLPLLFAVAKQFPKNHFVVVGEGEERSRLEKIKPVNVSLVGQKSREQVKKILAESDVFVLTSNYEGWGLAVIEALTAGLPVIMTDTGCAGEVVIDGKTGFVAPVGDEKALVTKMRFVLEHRELAADLALAGRQLVQRKLTTSWLRQYTPEGTPRHNNQFSR